MPDSALWWLRLYLQPERVEFTEGRGQHDPMSENRDAAPHSSLADSGGDAPSVGGTALPRADFGVKPGWVLPCGIGLCRGNS